MTTPGMRVVVDARMLDTAGIGTYIAEMLPRVLERLSNVPFTVLGDVSRLRELLGDRPLLDLRQWSTPIYTIREQLEARRLIPAGAVYWSPHFNIPLGWHGRLVVTVHDVALLVLPQASIARTLYARFMFSAVRRRASIVLFDSEFTAREFRNHVGVPHRYVVCHLGVAERWFSVPAGESPVDEPYLLYVGNVKPHKNLRRLLEAYRRVSTRMPHRLVIVGRRDRMRTVDEGAVALADALGRRVHVTGYAEPAVLERYIANCHALVLPSVYEGFGLPPLEALACGRQVAVSAAGALPEVCGPEAVYFDPLDVESIAAALEQVAQAQPDVPTDVERRRTQAARFDWARCADTVARELARELASGN